MKQIHFVTMILALLLAFSASAQTDIDAAESTYCGDTFTVQIVEDEAPAGAGINIAFVFADIGGDPVYVATNSEGLANYKPRITGILTIRVFDGITMVAETTVAVEAKPVDPVPIPTNKPSGGGGGGGMVFPTPTATPVVDVNDTAPAQVDPPVVALPVMQTAEEVIAAKPDSPKPKPTPVATDTPGFGGIVAISILGIVYLLRR